MKSQLVVLSLIALQVSCGKQSSSLKDSSAVKRIKTYDVMYEFRNGFAVVGQGTTLKSRKYGFININGDEIVAPQYDAAQNFEEDRALVKKDGQYGFIDNKGDVVVPIVYEDAHNFSEGLAAVKKDGKFGYVELQGTLTIAPQFSEAESFREGVAVVKSLQLYQESPYKSFNVKTGVIDTKGNLIVPFTYGYNSHITKPFSKGVALVDKFSNGKKTFIIVDKHGKEVKVLNDYHFVDGFSENTACFVSKDEKRAGFINSSGEELFSHPIKLRSIERDAIYQCDPFFKGIGFYSYTVLMGKNKNLTETIVWKKDGQIVPRSKYNYQAVISDKILMVQSDDGLIGFSGTDGKIVGEPKYTNVGLINRPSKLLKVCVNKNRLCGFVDKNTGLEVIAPKYDSISEFDNDGLAAVFHSGESYYMDETETVRLKAQ